MDHALKRACSELTYDDSEASLEFMKRGYEKEKHEEFLAMLIGTSRRPFHDSHIPVIP